MLLKRSPAVRPTPSGNLRDIGRSAQRFVPSHVKVAHDSQASGSRRRRRTSSVHGVSESVVTVLTTIRGRLEGVAAVTVVACITLKAQAADADFDVAKAIQRCVLQEL
jgi:hypothetical protein